MDKEMQKFQADLLQSVREMKAGKAARKTRIDVSPVAEARAKWACRKPSSPSCWA